MIRNFFNGIAIGIVEIIPGVSAGTIAILLGFYDKLIKSINHFTEDYKKHLKFFIPLGFGVIAGLLMFSSLITYLLTNYSFPTMTFFMGLIVGLIPIIYCKVIKPDERLKISEAFLVIVPIIILAIIANLRTGIVINPTEMINNISPAMMIFILIAGMLAAAALIIPGISGSFVLLILGIYPLAIYALSSISTYLRDLANTGLLLNISQVLIPLGIGVVIGGLSMARVIEKLLQNHHKKLYLVILGLLTGSVYALSKEPIVFQSEMTTMIVTVGVLTFVAGSILSYQLGKKKI